MRVASDSAESRNLCSLIRMANLYANICQVGQIDDTIEQMYCDMQTLIHETGGSIIPAHLNYVDARSNVNDPDKGVVTRTARVDENVTGRDFVVGGLHGEYDTLKAMLEAIEFEPGRDRLLALGELVDGSPRKPRHLRLDGGGANHAQRAGEARPDAPRSFDCDISPPLGNETERWVRDDE